VPSPETLTIRSLPTHQLSAVSRDGMKLYYRLMMSDTTAYTIPTTASIVAIAMCFFFAIIGNFSELVYNAFHTWPRVEFMRQAYVV